MPAHNRTDHGQQFNITPTHAFLLRYQIVHPGNCKQAATPDQDAQQCFYIGDIRQGKGGRKADGYAWKGYEIRDDTMIQVYEGYHQQNGAECIIDQGFDGQAKFQVRTQRQQAPQQFDHRVPQGEFSAAMPTTTPEPQVA